MKENWQRTLEFNLAWEGGYTERPEEPGGAVNKGISLLAYKEFCARRKRRMPTKSDLVYISDQDVTDFYKERAEQIGFDSLPAGYDLALFNASTMHGISQAKHWDTQAKGDIGYLIILQMERKLSEPSCAKFGKGWGKRLVTTYETAKDMEAEALQASRPGR